MGTQQRQTHVNVSESSGSPEWLVFLWFPLKYQPKGGSTRVGNSPADQKMDSKRGPKKEVSFTHGFSVTYKGIDFFLHGTLAQPRERNLLWGGGAFSFCELLSCDFERLGRSSRDPKPA